MSKIDLSKAKIGDKFRTRDGQILEYLGENLDFRDKYKFIDKQGFTKHFFQNGEYLYDEENNLDLVEQVFDDEKDTNDLLQRRQKVVELADRIFFSERGSVYSFKECIEVAEHSVNMINQYLKEGKL